ncbi:uncharacterized protein with HEPN domain [Oxalobacteraceae bacterium GrIS 2.11]
MNKKDQLRIYEYLQRIVERYTADMNGLGFLEDEKTQDAVVRNLKKYSPQI